MRGIRVHRVRLTDDEVEEGRGGLLLTTRQRTAIDLLRTMSSDEALALWAWLSTRRVLTLDEVRAAVASPQRRVGNGQLRRLLGLVADGAVSVAEHRLHELLRAAGIEGWEAGVTLRDEAGIIGVVDLFFETTRLVVEVDGFRAHSSQQSFVDDRRRQNRLIESGCRVLRFTWDDLTRRGQHVVGQIRRQNR